MARAVVDQAVAISAGVETRGGVFAPSRRALSLGILLAITAVAIEGMAVATVMPSVAVDLGGLEAYGWAFSAFMLASLLGAISAGEVADRRGLTTPGLIGYACFSLGLIIATIAPTWAVLLTARAVQGFGAGFISAVAYVAVARGYHERLRPRLLALLSSAWVVPSLVGPALAGQVAEHFTWRLVFIGILPAVVVGAAMLLPALARLAPAERQTARQGGGRLLAAARATAGVALLLLAPDVPLAPGAVVVALVGIVLAVPAFRRLLPKGTFIAANGLPAAVALRGLLAFGFFGAETIIPLGLSMERGLAPSLVGISLTAGALAWVVGSWMLDRDESRWANALSRRALRSAAGLVLVMVGMGGAAAVILMPSAPVVLAIAAWAFGGLGMGLAYPASTLTTLGLAPPGQEGSAAASLQVAETLGVALGAGAPGALYAMAGFMNRASAEGLLWAFVLTGVAIIVGLPAAARLAGSTRSR